MLMAGAAESWRSSRESNSPPKLPAMGRTPATALSPFSYPHRPRERMAGRRPQWRIHGPSRLRVGLSLGHPVFLSVRRTVSQLVDSTISNANTCRDSSRSLRLESPGGGEPRQVAITFASIVLACSPLSGALPLQNRNRLPLRLPVYFYRCAIIDGHCLQRLYAPSDAPAVACRRAVETESRALGGSQRCQCRVRCINRLFPQRISFRPAQLTHAFHELLDVSTLPFDLAAEPLWLLTVEMLLAHPADLGDGRHA